MSVPTVDRPGVFDGLLVTEGEKFDKIFELQAPVVDENDEPVRDSRGAPTYQSLNTAGWTGSFQIKTKRDGTAVVNVTEDLTGSDGYVVVFDSKIEVVIYAVKTPSIKSSMFYELFAGLPSDQRMWLSGLTRKRGG